MSTRRRLNTEERRHEILAAAGTCFRASPYPSVSLATIAAASASSEALIYHYFKNKAGLHAATVSAALTRQHNARAGALTDLIDGQPTSYRVEVFLLAHLDAMVTDPLLLPAPGEPTATVALRQEAEERFSQELAELVGTSPDYARHQWAVTGAAGFLHRAALRWSQLGFPADQRRPLVEATIGALHGAVGDWGGG